MGVGLYGNRSLIGTPVVLVSASAVQLQDLSTDYYVYFNVTTAGTATSITLGPTASANLLTVAASSTATVGQLYTVFVPAGWYFKFTGTTTVMQYTAVAA